MGGRSPDEQLQRIVADPEAPESDCAKAVGFMTGRAKLGLG
ncbi:hypothetical protein Z947_3767 [Sulfitobacter geojensis]|nr:hypothetical protein Z947_3767 [Sulfitobacter geojensis]